jgi:hypothetical protein
LRHVFGPGGNPVGELVGAVLVELVTEVEELDTEVVVAIVVLVLIVVELDTDVLELILVELDTEVLVAIVVVLVPTLVLVVLELVVVLVELDVETAIQLHALLTRPTTSPPQAATANVGIAVAPVTTFVVNVAQNA